MKKGLNSNTRANTRTRTHFNHNNGVRCNFTVYVVRTSSYGEMVDSAPCMDCYERMKEIGVKKIVYSSGTAGEITKLRFKDYVPKTITLGRQYINGGFAPIYRDRADERIINYK